MASLRLDNIPDELMKRLELAATARKRELATEVVNRLDDSFGRPHVAERRTHAELSKLARQIRGEVPGDWMTPEFIRMARDWGRD